MCDLGELMQLLICIGEIQRQACLSPGPELFRSAMLWGQWPHPWVERCGIREATNRPLPLTHLSALLRETAPTHFFLEPYFLLHLRKFPYTCTTPGEVGTGIFHVVIRLE